MDFDHCKPDFLRHLRALTFDMSGNWKRVQPAGNRPLD